MIEPSTRQSLGRYALCLVLGVALASGMSAALANAVDELSDADRTAIRQAIRGQIEAFKADDADLAFSFATPMIRHRFGNASRFVAMVKRGYRPVYRPRQIEFTDLLDVRGKPTQRLVVIGPDNGVFSAYYLMERQPDGSWRISGCIIRPIGDRST
ncbi:MAG: DUF4864 domain-containing protein [Alphaproteobacteria bacterium]|nr:DUF4864 domain-containing protein [Alphaproteobacteria bacterium]